jgi:hypothetical protein
MRVYSCPFLVLLLLEFLVTADLSSQDRRLLIISPRVGPVVDSLERANYRLFRSIHDFESASYFQAPDSSFWVWVMMKFPNGNVQDSAFEISYRILEQTAERIDHQEELLKRTYVMGSSPEEIYYADGARVIPPSTDSAKVPVLPRQALDDILPLAPNLAHLSRPRFPTIHLALSIGVAQGNFSGLTRIIGKVSNVFVPVSLNMEVPVSVNPALSFVSGWGFALGGAGGGGLTEFSAAIFYRLNFYSSFTPIIGFGASQNWYSKSDSLNISTSLVSPTLVFGLQLDPTMLDILLSIPLRTSLHTTFESQSYAIEPTGVRLSLLVAF